MYWINNCEMQCGMSCECYILTLQAVFGWLGPNKFVVFSPNTVTKEDAASVHHIIYWKVDAMK